MFRFGNNTSEFFRKNIEVPFFNYYLKGKGNVDDIAEANIFFTGENNWKKMSQWPPQNVAYQSLLIQADGKLSFENETIKSGGSVQKKAVRPLVNIPVTRLTRFLIPKMYMTNEQENI
jgi:predicted acyl esterase